MKSDVHFIMSMHHIPVTVIYANILLSKAKQFLLLLQWRSRFSDPINWYKITGKWIGQELWT